MKQDRFFGRHKFIRFLCFFWWLWAVPFIIWVHEFFNQLEIKESARDANFMWSEMWQLYADILKMRDIR